MRILLIGLLLLSGEAIAAATCTFNDLKITVPSLILTARDGTLPLMISNAWHEVGGGAALCKGSLFTGFALTNNQIGSTAKKMTFEGASYEIYDSGTDGVGVIMGVGDANGPYLPFTTSETIFKQWSSTLIDPVITSKYRMRFVATKRLPAGVINIPPLTIMRQGIYSSGISYLGWGLVSTTNTQVNVISPLCKPSVPGSVRLPMAETRYLSTTGATTGETAFTIGLDCGAGETSVNVKYTFTDVSAPTNNTSELGLTTASSTASGVAIQVLDDGVPINFGPDSSLIGTPNQRPFGSVASIGGHVSKSFTARYIKTAAPLVPGQLNAAMSITFSYQ